MAFVNTPLRLLIPIVAAFLTATTLPVLLTPVPEPVEARICGQNFDMTTVDGDSSYISRKKLNDYFVLDGDCRDGYDHERSNSTRMKCQWTFEVIQNNERAQMPERIPAAKCIKQSLNNCVPVYFPVPVWVYDKESSNWKMEYQDVAVACVPAERSSHVA